MKRRINYLHEIDTVLSEIETYIREKGNIEKAIKKLKQIIYECYGKIDQNVFLALCNIYSFLAAWSLLRLKSNCFDIEYLKNHFLERVKDYRKEIAACGS